MEGVLKIESLDVALITVLMLLPGYMMRMVTSQALGRESSEGELRIVELVVRSALAASALLMALLLFGVVGTEQDFQMLMTATPPHLWLLLATVFLVPVLLGLVEVLLIRLKPFEWLLEAVGVPLKPMEVSAWQQRFMAIYKTRNQRRLVKVALKNGAIIYGGLEEGSYASGIGDDKDLYIAKQYKPNASGVLQEIQGSDGVLVMGEAVDYIEFLYIP